MHRKQDVEGITRYFRGLYQGAGDDAICSCSSDTAGREGVGQLLPNRKEEPVGVKQEIDGMVENNKEAIVLLALETGERASPLERQKSQDFEEVREEGPARLRVLAGRFWSSPPGLKSKVQKVTLAFPATASVGNTRRTLSERWHICSCGVKCQRDLYSAYLACFVEQIGENNSELDAGVAARQWPGAERSCKRRRAVFPTSECPALLDSPAKGQRGWLRKRG